MTANQFLTDVTDLLTNCAVIVPLVFLAVFSFWHRWWRDTYGRCLGLLAIAMFGSRLMSALQLWGLRESWYRWVATAALGVGPVVFTVLAWKLLAPHLPWVRRQRSTIEDLLREDDLPGIRR